MQCELGNEQEVRNSTRGPNPVIWACAGKIIFTSIEPKRKLRAKGNFDTHTIHKQKQTSIWVNAGSVTIEKDEYPLLCEWRVEPEVGGDMNSAGKFIFAMLILRVVGLFHTGGRDDLGSSCCSTKTQVAMTTSTRCARIFVRRNLPARNPKAVWQFPCDGTHKGL